MSELRTSEDTCCGCRKDPPKADMHCECSCHFAIRTSKTVDNPWREFIENVISGKNYFRTSEYRELIADLDRLYALEEKHATQTAVVHMGIDDQPHDGRRIDCVKCHSDETECKQGPIQRVCHALTQNCVMFTDPERAACTPENCNAVRAALKASGDPYVATCQGGSGGKCCDPDCEKCWPDPPAESENAS